ncbi:MAG TPA: TAT-variant-translocated molybdopterin oxidoreductase, partial [Vicinamibacteria bacterium]
MSDHDRLAEHSRKPAAAQGRQYWKSLDELARSPAFEQFLHREFPEQASEWNDPAGRRDFLRLMGASLALAGVGGACTRQPRELVVPYVKAPEEAIPGRPLFFATALVDAGYASGVLVESHMGRPTKIEGNPDHPVSLGGSDAVGQAAILDLYDPDRSQTLTYLGEIRPWNGFLAAMRSVLEAQRAQKGAGLRLLTGTVTSPTLAAQIQELLAELPAARWHQWEAAGRHSARAGARLAFGEPVDAHYDLGAADVVVCLDADFVGSGPARLQHIRQYATRRRAAAQAALGTPGAATGSAPFRLYAVESSPTPTGALADHRLCLRAAEVETFARGLAAALGVGAQGGEAAHGPFLTALVKDLLQRPAGTTLVLAGEHASPAVHALAHAANEKLGNVGRTVRYTEPVEARADDQLASIAELTRAMMAGTVQVLLILGVNPAYDAPADLGFATQMDKVPLRVHLGLHQDETAERCHWHVPMAHSLESWGDARAADGTVTILQPLIAPLYGGKSAHEVMAAFTARPDRSGHDVLREHWARQPGLAGAGFEAAWRRALHDGVLRAAPAPAPKSPAVRAGAWAAPADAGAPGRLELIFRPDPWVGDGRHANNGWLQELPRPLTKLTWENAALLSPATAERLGVRVEPSARGTRTDLIELRYRGRTVAAPAWVVPGHPDDSVTVHLGYGRRRAGRVGTGLGFDAYALRTSDAPWSGPGLEVRRLGDRVTLACTQDHWSMEGRHLVREATAEELGRDVHVIQALGHDPARELTMHPSYRYDGHAWGMAIDLNSCVGCNACVVACQSENNIPVVGKEQVARGREMHWLRVDRYYSGDPQDARTLTTRFQPVPCMHCENAPCEVVCPVAATVHSDEGLNDMVYNRCVGTRYCSNNCPYKVRRFNFFLYNDWTTESLKLQRNPDVTVRSRGVMEKCTYCVQRINAGRIQAKREDRNIRDGEVLTACQSVCPTDSIVFGDITDPNSRVSQLKASQRNYS